jgi:hypothetical protein
MDKFRVDWESSIVWTREMPSLLKITQPNYLSGGEVGGGSYNPAQFPLVGFYEWPCGVLDPVMGIEIINKEWWTCAGWKTGQASPEIMTEQQRIQFKQLRQLQLLKLEEKNGFDKFKQTILGLLSLRMPPSISPSLAVHPEHMRVTYPAISTAAIGQPNIENVPDPGGTVWSGSAVQSSVTVAAPISVQPNPYGGAGQARRAASDIVFGYEIAVIPVGGEKQTSADWKWPLYHPAFATPTTSQYKDLYHDMNGEIQVPYSRSKKISTKASTWKTVTDGQQRDKIDEQDQEITFSMTVDVCDQKPHLKHGLIPFDQSAPDQAIWVRQHGAIWVTIEADKKENKDRSFEVIIEVTETAAVDKKGRRKGEAGFSGFKTYTRQMPMPVDIYRIYVPTGYFDWLNPFLEILRHVKKSMEIPGPSPDDDPLLELSLWRTVLERNPTFLQAYVLELRRITDRPFVMPHHALAELDAVVRKLSELSRTGMLFQGSDELRSDNDGRRPNTH